MGSKKQEADDLRNRIFRFKLGFITAGAFLISPQITAVFIKGTGLINVHSDKIGIVLSKFYSFGELMFALGSLLNYFIWRYKKEAMPYVTVTSLFLLFLCRVFLLITLDLSKSGVLLLYIILNMDAVVLGFLHSSLLCEFPQHAKVIWFSIICCGMFVTALQMFAHFFLTYSLVIIKIYVLMSVVINSLSLGTWLFCFYLERSLPLNLSLPIITFTLLYDSKFKKIKDFETELVSCYERLTSYLSDRYLLFEFKSTIPSIYIPELDLFGDIAKLNYNCSDLDSLLKYSEFLGLFDLHIKNKTNVYTNLGYVLEFIFDIEKLANKIERSIKKTKTLTLDDSAEEQNNRISTTLTQLRLELGDLKGKLDAQKIGITKIKSAIMKKSFIGTDDKFINLISKIEEEISSVTDELSSFITLIFKLWLTFNANNDETSTQPNNQTTNIDEQINTLTKIEEIIQQIDNQTSKVAEKINKLEARIKEIEDEMVDIINSTKLKNKQEHSINLTNRNYPFSKKLLKAYDKLTLLDKKFETTKFENIKETTNQIDRVTQYIKNILDMETRINEKRTKYLEKKIDDEISIVEKKLTLSETKRKKGLLEDIMKFISPLLMIVPATLFKNFLYPGILPYALLHESQCRTLNWVVYPVLVLAGFEVLTMDEFFGMREWDWYYNLLWMLVYPQLIIFVLTILAIHSHRFYYTAINSTFSMFLMTVILILSSGVMELVSYLGVANYVFYRSDDILDSLKIIVLHNITGTLCHYFFTKLSVGYNVTRIGVGLVLPELQTKYGKKYSIWFFIVGTLTTALKDIFKDFKLNIRDYL